MKPGCTCLSHKEGLIISNGSEKIKNAYVLPREPKLEKDAVRNFKLASRSSALTIWSYSHWPILQAIRNDQAKDGQESTFYMTTLISVRLLSLFLGSEKVKVLNHLPYSLDLSPCYFFLFPRLKKMLSGNKYTSRSSLGSAIYQCL